MTPTETLILAAYFFVVVVLAVYGWHRYYIVYLYMKHKGQRPQPLATLAQLPRVTIQLPIYNEEVRGENEGFCGGHSVWPGQIVR